MLSQIDFVEILSSFIVMFAIIDITGSIPIFLSIKEKNQTIQPFKACLVSLVFFVAFFFLGDALLKLFGVDVPSFAVAGSFVIFILAVEMIIGIEIMKTEDRGSGASIVPIAFPLIAGPGALTAVLSLRAEYAVINIMIAIVLNLIIDFLVLHSVEKIQKVLGGDIIYIIRKFFGVILLAIAVKMFASNLTIVISSLS
ncbi:MAG: MarC family protein [Bacteroidales bacterium]|nr:MarC family protein [Bacteroidales bacterium]